jgi:hypothetical protein
MHSFNADSIEWYLTSRKKRVDKLILKSGTNYKHLNTLCEESLRAFVVSNTLKQNEHKQFYFNIGSKVAMLLPKIKSDPEKETVINLVNKENITFKVNEDDTLKSVEWLRAWYIATVLRDKNAIADIYNIDISNVKPVNDKDHLRIGYLYFKLLYSLGLDEKPDMNLFNEMEAIVLKNMNSYYMPDVAEFPYPNYFFNFNRALILKAIIDNDQEAFTKHMFEGVTYHKMFWGRKEGLNKGEAHLCEDPQGFISWSHTALAAMAYDRGLKIEVDSDYIPMWMIEGNWKNNM